MRIEDVDVIDAIDTDVTPWTITTGSYASRFSVVVTAAVQRSAVSSARICGRSRLICSTVSRIAWKLADGLVRMLGTNRSISLRQLAGAVQWNRGDFPDGLDVQIQVSESYGAPNLASPDLENRVNAAVTYGFMADAVMIEIDPGTCVPRVLRYAAVHDVGEPINPQLIRGQVAGGIIHGIGGALYEHCDYDEGGQMLTASFMDYLCPTAVEAPRMSIDHHDSPSPFSLLGSKGAGENCAMSAPAAVASAVEDALRTHNVSIVTLPITPAAIWAQLHGAAA